MHRTRRLVLAVLAAVLAACVVAALSRPVTDPVRRAVRDAIVHAETGDARRAVHAADLAYQVASGRDGTAELSAFARALAGDLPTAFARMELAARGAPDDGASALAAGLLARCLAQTARNGPELRRRARSWFDEAVRRADAGPPPPSFERAALAAAARLASGDAADALRRAVALRPGDDAQREQAALLRSAACVARGDFDGATTALRAASSGPPTARVAAALARIEAWRAQAGEPPVTAGLRAWAGGDARGAVAALTRAVSAEPANPVALCVLATALARSGDAASLAASIDHLHATSSGGPAEPYFVGCHLLASGRPDDAAWMLAAASLRAPDDPHVVRAVAEADLARGAPDRAAEACRAWIARRPEPDRTGPATADAHRMLGIALETLGDDSGAASAFRAALDACPTDAAAADRLADLLVRTGRVAEALAVTDAVPGPAPLAIRVRRAVTLLALGRRDEAERAFRDIAGEAPACAAAHLYLGRIAAGRGDFDGAAAAFEGALRAEPDAVDAHLGLLGVLRATGRGDAHRAELRDAAAREPSAVRSFVLGAAAELAGDTDDAEARYRDALRRAPAMGVAANNLAWLLAVRRRRPGDALPLANDAVRRLPRSPQALDTRGWVRFLLRDFAAAEGDLARARAALPRDADVALRHARALLAVGRPEPARAALRAAFALAPRLRRDPVARTVARSLELEIER